MTSQELKNLREDLKDELLAINNYQAHIDATDDIEVRRALEHIRDEEKEHVAELVNLLKEKDQAQNEKFEKEE